MIEYAHIGNFQVAQAELVPLLKKYQLLPKILRELTIDRAIAQIECSAAERRCAIEQFYDRDGLTSAPQLEKWLALYGIERSELAEIAVRNFKIAKFKQATWGGKVASYFLNRKAQLDRVVYSLIRTSELGIAQEIYFRAIAGEQSFAELTIRYSQGAEAITGGPIGPAQLSAAELTKLVDRSELARYRMGQAVMAREQMPKQTIVVYSGQLRLLTYNPQDRLPPTLQLLEKGEILGWAG